jgi:ribulose-phosphate 3-epimerase
MRIKIAPSILASDFTRLAEEVAEVEAGGADLLHVDVMDGHFVPNLTVGVPVVRHLRRVTRLPLDVHLMIDNPEAFVDPFVDAGADSLSVHFELGAGPIGTVIDRIHERGRRAALVVNPETPIEPAAPLLHRVEMVLVMSVRPGFGGQSFMPEVLSKVRWLRRTMGPDADIEIDGGIDPDTVTEAARAGANVLVAGTAVFGQRDRAGAIRALREAAADSLK